MPNKSATKSNKIAKRKKRLDKIKLRSQANIEKQANSIKFQINEYDKSIVSSIFVEEIIQELKNIRLNNRYDFTKEEERFFKDAKKFGFERSLYSTMKRLPDEIQFVTQLQLRSKIGSIVFDKLNQKGTLLQHIPFNDVNIVPKEDGFIVLFDALLKAKTPYGTIRYSPLKPKITLDDKEYIVSFTRHAIERICERSVSNWKTYNGAGDCFAYLKKCLKFDVLPANDNDSDKKLITFYDICAPGFLSRDYVNHLIDNVTPNKNYYYRVGYCPIGLQDNFACAKTFLTPGMKGTPEDILLREAPLDRTTKKQIENAIQDTISINVLSETMNFSAPKWFHNNGIPQVLEINERVFE